MQCDPVAGVGSRSERALYTASKFLADLRRLASGETAALLPNTLAIIDFDNLGDNASDDWLGSGLAESLGMDIGRVEGLILVPRPKVLQMRAVAGKKNNPVEIGRAVG